MENIITINFPLGRKHHDPIVLAQAPSHRFGVIQPQPSLNRTLVDFTPGIYHNDTYPDCTYVSMTNVARGVAFLNGYELAVDPDKVTAGYAANAGCANTPAAILATDGLVMQDVAVWQARKGYDIGPQRLVAQSGVIPLNKTALALAMQRLGLPWCGVVLYQRDMDSIGPYSVLDVQAGRDDGAIVGRHAIPLWTYLSLGDDGRLYFGTYGFWQAATWAWLLERIEEAHGLVYRQLAKTDGTFYNGLTSDGLVNAL